MAQAFLQEQLFRFEFSNDLLQPRILFLERTQSRQLRLPSPAEPPAAVVICGVIDTRATVGRRYITTACELHPTLTQKLQYVLVGATFQSHQIPPQTYKEWRSFRIGGQE